MGRQCCARVGLSPSRRGDLGDRGGRRLHRPFLVLPKLGSGARGAHPARSRRDDHGGRQRLASPPASRLARDRNRRERREPVGRGEREAGATAPARPAYRDPPPAVEPPPRSPFSAPHGPPVADPGHRPWPGRRRQGGEGRASRCRCRAGSSGAPPRRPRPPCPAPGGGGRSHRLHRRPGFFG